MRLVVLGGGESGVGTAILGKEKGYDVFVSDFGKIKENYKKVLSDNGIAWEDEKHTEDLILNADVVMKSPGIPEKAPIVKKLAEKGISPIPQETERTAAPLSIPKVVGNLLIHFVLHLFGTQCLMPHSVKSLFEIEKYMIDFLFMS